MFFPTNIFLFQLWNGSRTRVRPETRPKTKATDTGGSRSDGNPDSHRSRKEKTTWNLLNCHAEGCSSCPPFEAKFFNKIKTEIGRRTDFTQNEEENSFWPVAKAYFQEKFAVRAAVGNATAKTTPKGSFKICNNWEWRNLSKSGGRPQIYRFTLQRGITLNFLSTFLERPVVRLPIMVKLHVKKQSINESLFRYSSTRRKQDARLELSKFSPSSASKPREHSTRRNFREHLSIFQWWPLQYLSQTLDIPQGLEINTTRFVSTKRN